MWKNFDNGGTDWRVMDEVINPSNQANIKLSPNTNAAEQNNAGFNGVDFVSDGFKIRSSDSGFNANGQSVLFMAFATNPFKYANAR